MSISVSTLLFRLKDYYNYFIQAGNEHDVHSPFVFKLLTESIYSKKTDPSFEKIENLRKELKNDRTLINTTDLGAGSTHDGKIKSRTIREIAVKFAKTPKYCRYLFNCINHLKPQSMIELGTSLGISTMYQASGNPEMKIYTLEGCTETSKIARLNFEKLSYGNIECITGNFDVTLQQVLELNKKVDYAFIDGNHTYEATIRYFSQIKKYSTPNTFLIFDDINWSPGMKNAWNEIKSDKDVTITIDFYEVGMVFFNKDFSKQDFILKLK